MQVPELDIPGVMLVEPDVFRDDRGFLFESYNKAKLAAQGIADDFVQDNQSWSAKRGTVRGLHFQAPPHAQGKLVRTLGGSVIDVAVDIRTGSPTYGRHVAVELSAANKRQLWVPPGFAHGFCTLEDDCTVAYKLTAPHALAAERGLLWNDPELAIAWPVATEDAVLSPKDRDAPRLRDLEAYFTFGA